MESELLSKVFQEIGLLHLTSGHVVMWFVGSVLIYLGIRKKYEPYLMLPIGFGIIAVNLPLEQITFYYSPEVFVR